MSNARDLTTLLPADWDTPALGEVATFNPRPSKQLFELNPKVTFLPMANVAEVSGHTDQTQAIRASDGKKKNLTYLEDSDVIFAKITPCMENGKIARPTGLLNGFAFASTEFHVLRPTSRINGEYLRLFLVNDTFRHDAERAMTGAVGQRRVPKKYLEEHKIPLPSLEEQDRIVEILEEQLSRLDAALESIRKVREKAARFRRSLLHAAFSGHLTNSIASEWEATTIESVAALIRGLTYKKPQAQVNPTAGHVELLRATNVQDDQIVLDDLLYVPDDLVDPAQHLQVDDLLVVTSSGSPTVVGKSAPINEPIEATFGAFCAVLRPIGKIEPAFLHHFAQSGLVRDRWSKAARGTNINNLKPAEIMATPINLPSLEEQRSIVNEIEDHVRRQFMVLEAQRTSEIEIARLRRSLLSAAFAGQLTESWRAQHNG